MSSEKMEITQNIYMDMGNFMQMLAAMAPDEEEVDLSNLKIEMVTRIEGIFEYYDFDGEVVFPEITEENILDLENTMMPQN